MKPAIVYPMGFYVFYILGLLLYMFKTRKKSVMEGRVKPSFFKSYQGDVPQETVILGRHFDNQFQFPLLFLVTCTLSIILLQNEFWCTLFAWCFVVLRLVHSYVHLGSNSIQARFMVFGASILFLAFIWIRILI